MKLISAPLERGKLLFTRCLIHALDWFHLSPLWRCHHLQAPHLFAYFLRLIS